jgi:hypothetical protein
MTTGFDPDLLQCLLLFARQPYQEVHDPPFHFKKIGAADNRWREIGQL